MDTMTYASSGVFRGCVAEKNNQPVRQEAEFSPLDLSQTAALRSTRNIDRAIQPRPGSWQLFKYKER